MNLEGIWAYILHTHMGEPGGHISYTHTHTQVNLESIYLIHTHTHTHTGEPGEHISYTHTHTHG